MLRAIAGKERVLALSLSEQPLGFGSCRPAPCSPTSWLFSPVPSGSSSACCNPTCTTIGRGITAPPCGRTSTIPRPTALKHSRSPTAWGLAAIGQRYHAHRRQIMLARQEGLTKTYNRFHDPEERSADIQKLRQLHVEMDQRRCRRLRLGDLNLGHGFHETKQGVRYTISELARRDVLARLLKLNHERYAEEVKQGSARHRRRNEPLAQGSRSQENHGNRFSSGSANLVRRDRGGHSVPSHGSGQAPVRPAL